MEIKYKNKKIKKICTDASIAEKEYGQEIACKIQIRIDQISSSPNVELLVQSKMGRCHLLKGNRKNQYAMDLKHPYRLIFTVDKEFEIQIAEIKEIIDYH